MNRKCFTQFNNNVQPVSTLKSVFGYFHIMIPQMHKGQVKGG